MKHYDVHITTKPTDIEVIGAYQHNNPYLNVTSFRIKDFEAKSWRDVERTIKAIFGEDEVLKLTIVYEPTNEERSAGKKHKIYRVKDTVNDWIRQNKAC